MRLEINLEQFRNDLDWAVNSPVMMRPDLTKKPFNASLLQQLNRWLRSHRAEIPEAVFKCARLGIYFEQLWKYIFENCPLFDLIAHNLPVYEDKQTRGAFDFVYYCHIRKAHFHLEVAVKFYLGIPGANLAGRHWSSWVGPGGEDRLDLKLSKMLNQQTELSTTEPGRISLQKLGIDSISPELLLKGRLFYPFAKNFAEPADCTSDHLHDHWLDINQLHLLPETGVWQPLSRNQWFSDSSGFGSGKLAHTSLAAALTQSFSEYSFPVMLGYNPEPTQPGNRMSRYFITPADWLRHTRANLNGD